MIILSISTLITSVLAGAILNLLVSILPSVIGRILPQKIRDNANKIFQYVEKFFDRTITGIGSILNKIASNPVLTSLVVLVICFSIIFSFTVIKNSKGEPYYSYNDGFVENILVESHGMLLDIIVFGIIIAIIELYRGKNQEIKRYNEEIEDFREWDEKEAKYRIGGNLKRLQGLGETNINLTDCFLENFKYDKLKLIQSTLNHVNFTDSKIKNAIFYDCELRGSKFNRAELLKAKFVDSKLYGAHFNEAQLYGVNFKGATLDNADFRGAKFKRFYSTNPTFTREEIENPSNYEHITVRKADFTGATMNGAKALESDRETLIECNADITNIIFSNK